MLFAKAKYDGDGWRIETIAGSNATLYDYSAGSWDPIYLNNLNSGAVGDVVFAGIRIGGVQGGVNYYDHLDRLGSVRLVTQSNSIQLFTAKYLPYGATYGTSGSERFQYTGKEFDVSTGLYYYGYRYYDGQSGRFIAVDPVEPNSEQPQSQSLLLCSR
jgi:RHS repeat-associated protein